MLIIYGLGNNDHKYLQTKHNVGRIVLEDLAKSLRLSWEKRDHFTYTKYRLANNEIFLVYSNGYMNTSGDHLLHFFRFFKIDAASIDALIILHDDSDQQEGLVKLLPAGGSAGHKGVQNIYDRAMSISLNSSLVWRLKIGIRPPQNRLRSETFVLNKLSTQEETSLGILSQTLRVLLSDLEKQNFAKAQNILNTKNK